jgi:NADH-quinone oxidoreductase subunit G
MATIIVDGREYSVKDGANLLEACLSHSLDLPYFCWHPELDSVGACRQCAVIQYQDEEDTRGRLTMACMTPAADGCRISVEAPRAREFREAVIEWLMLNHPHDCPVCIEGGECHLQDMTVMSGHTVRRSRQRKRTFANQDLGPFITHEMNRCITCYRCVRYYKDYAGGTDLEAFGSRDRVYFGRTRDGTLENEFSGNLVEVCPTGVFGDKPFAQSYTRKWDLQSAPSICQGCALGCNTIPGERYGALKRVHNRYHADVNGYFLCDRGRFGAHFVNSEDRLRNAGRKTPDGVFDELTEEAAVEELANRLTAGGVVGIGSPRASLESNFALRTLVGEENFASGLSAGSESLAREVLDIYRQSPARISSLKDIESADAVLVLGEDVLNTAPRVALALRQSVRNAARQMAAGAGIPAWQDAGIRSHGRRAQSPLFNLSVAANSLDSIAVKSHHDAPDNLARLGFAVAAELQRDYAAPEDLEPAELALAGQIAEALGEAKRPLVICGSGSNSLALLQAAANVAWALTERGCDAALCLNVEECNTLGATWLAGDISVETALEKVVAGEAKSLIILENDLYRRVPQVLVDGAFATGRCVALDVLETPTVERCALALPAATFAECEGTLVNNEARAQHYYQVFAPVDPVRASWRWLAAAGKSAGRNDLDWRTTDQVTQALADSVAGLSAIAGGAPGDEYRTAADMRLPRQPHRYSGRTAMRADKDVHERQAPLDEDSPLSFSMEGGYPKSAPVLPYVWAPGWNSNQSIIKFQREVSGDLLGGTSDVKLFEPQPGQSKAGAYKNVPGKFVPDEPFLVVPVARIFGGDELSAASPAIGMRTRPSRLLLNPEDAQRLGAAEGAGIRIDGVTVQLTIDESVPTGVALCPFGLADGPRTAPTQRVPLELDTDYQSPEEKEIFRG